MENNWLKKACNLEETKTSISGASYFKTAGSLEKPIKANETFFKPAGDLDTSTQNNSFKFQEKEETIQTPEEIRAWLKTIVSGVKKSNYAFGEGASSSWGRSKIC